MTNFNKRILLILSIFLCTFLILQQTDTVKMTPILKPLSDFPKTIGDWHQVESIDMADEVEIMLGVDDYINWNYISHSGNKINLYISYFEAVGVSGEYHSPLHCMPGGGRKIIKEEVIKIPGIKDKIKKLTLVYNGNVTYSYYWYFNRGRVIFSEYLEKIYLVLDAVFKGRRDGSFIRIITYPDNSGKFNVNETFEFISQINEISSHFIPGEKLEKEYGYAKN